MCGNFLRMAVSLSYFHCSLQMEAVGENQTADLRKRKGVKPMPYKPMKPCHQPGCPELVEPGKQYCAKHLPLHPEVTRSAAERGYGKRWQRVSRLFLQEHPFCVECLKETPPRYTKATVVDHIVPHRGDPKVFWDKSGWQPLCKRHHDIKTGREDSRPTYTF